MYHYCNVKKKPLWSPHFGFENTDTHTRAYVRPLINQNWRCGPAGGQRWTFRVHAMECKYRIEPSEWGQIKTPETRQWRKGKPPMRSCFLLFFFPALAPISFTGFPALENWPTGYQVAANLRWLYRVLLSFETLGNGFHWVDWVTQGKGKSRCAVIFHRRITRSHLSSSSTSFWGKKIGFSTMCPGSTGLCWF